MIQLIFLLLIVGCTTNEVQNIHLTPIESTNDCAILGNQEVNIEIYPNGYVETSQGEL